MGTHLRPSQQSICEVYREKRKKKIQRMRLSVLGGVSYDLVCVCVCVKR